MKNLDHRTYLEYYIYLLKYNHQIMLLFAPFIDYNSRVERIKTFGNNIQNNIDKFFDASSKFVKTRGLDGKLLLIGQILSAVTDFVFD